jgi:hypothetical protein
MRFKKSLSRLVKRAAAGKESLIAMLSRIPAVRNKVPYDVFKGKIEMADDFDAPLEDFKDYV